jgi:S-DNA-T family DNA segregation ATPase FtsK/SpoIIIE
VAYRVAQKVDSRTILDEQGAEVLLGRGDMLAKMNGSSETQRVQCPFISEEEVRDVTDHLRRQGTPAYHDDILRAGDDEEDEAPGDTDVDPRFDEAVRLVADTQKCSTSWIQRKLKLGYNRAARIVEMMEHQGMVGPQNGSKEREIWIQPQ